MNTYFLTTGMPPPFLGGSGTYYYNIFHRFPPGELTIFTEKSRSRHSSYDSVGVRYIRRSYIKPNVSLKGKNRFLKNIPGFTRISDMVMILFWSLELMALCTLNRPNTVFVGQIYPTGIIGLILLKLFRIPYIVFVHGEEIAKSEGKNRRKLYIKVLDKSARIICNSRFTFNLLKNIIKDDKKITIVTPMVDTEKYHPNYDVTTLKKKYNINGDKIILSVGRLKKRKGHARILSVIKKILTKVDRLKYIIVGTDAGEKEQLELEVKRRGLSENVIFADRVSTKDLPIYYCLCDVMVLPNYELPNGDTEGFGMVFLEANACGKPVIGGRAGGTSDAVVHGKTGILVDADDESLHNAISFLLLNEKDAKEMGQAGRKRVLSSFNWTQAMESVRNLGIEVNKPK